MNTPSAKFTRALSLAFAVVASTVTVALGLLNPGAVVRAQAATPAAPPVASAKPSTAITIPTSLTGSPPNTRAKLALVSPYAPDFYRLETWQQSMVLSAAVQAHGASEGVFKELGFRLPESSGNSTGAAANLSPLIVIEPGNTTVPASARNILVTPFSPDFTRLPKWRQENVLEAGVQAGATTEAAFKELNFRVTVVDGPVPPATGNQTASASTTPASVASNSTTQSPAAPPPSK